MFVVLQYTYALFPVAIERFVKVKLRNINESLSSIVFGHYRFGDKARSSIKIDQNSKVTSITNTRQNDNNQHIVNSGVYYFKYQDLKIFKAQNMSGEIADELLLALVNDQKLECHINTFPRISIDSLETLAEAQNAKFVS